MGRVTLDKMRLAIHFQYMTDKGKLAKELFNSGKPFIVSIVPNLLDKSMKTEEGEEIYNRIHMADNYYPEWAKEIFRENKDNEKIMWVQEGYRHCCGKCYNKRQENDGKGTDPFHEHICLDGATAQSLEKQVEVISKGKQLLKDVLGIIPLGYCPPNHLYNKDTAKAVNINDIPYFLTRNGFDSLFPNLIKLPTYADGNLLVFPETKKGKSPVIMTYYSDIAKGKVPEYKTLLNLSNLDIPDAIIKPNLKCFINEKLIFAYKRIRDIRDLWSDMTFKDLFQIK